MTDYSGWASYVQPTQPGYLAQNNANLAYVNNANQQSLNPNTLYGAGGFGGMTDAYSAAGAAYGRATGGFTPTTPMGSVFDTGTTPYQSYGQPQTYSDPNAGSSQAQAYYQAHLAKYGYAPELTNSTYNALLGGDATGGSAGSGGYNSFGGGAYGAMAGGAFGGMVGSTPSSGPGSGIDAINAAAGIDPNTGNQFQVPGALNFDRLNPAQQSYYNQYEGRYGSAPDVNNPTLQSFANYGGASPTLNADEDPTKYWGAAYNSGSYQAAQDRNPLIAQRAGISKYIGDNPGYAFDMAARAYTEEQNNAASRTGVLEAMFNKNIATGDDPLSAAYYPKGQTYQDQYQANRTALENNPDLLGRIYTEMGNVMGGSNLNNYATDWASGGTAADEAKYATSTWTSPTNEQFFRKDISNPTTGATTAAKNQQWYGNLTNPGPLANTNYTIGSWPYQ